MDHQYNIINQCLQLLKQSDIPTIKKLRVEIQLIQMKRLLLNQELSKSKLLESCGDAAFEGLLCQMRGISGGSAGSDALADLMSSIGGILTQLGGNHPSA